MPFRIEDVISELSFVEDVNTRSLSVVNLQPSLIPGSDPLHRLDVVQRERRT